MRHLALALLALLIVVAPARAADSSANVERIATIPDLPTAISLNFLGDTLFASTVTGVFAYDISDPAKPRRVGSLPMYIWENEDVDIDRARKRLFISRDPRGFTTPATPGSAFPVGAVHVVDISDPANLREIGFFTVPAGHTTSCVGDCSVIWTAGPGANPATQPGFTGRPVYGTDVTDPANPVPCPAPIDLGRNDGVTDYAHDVQVDPAGIAWVSGAGGIRGYWTSGTHRDPVTGQTRAATGCDPVPYAGSGSPDTATPSRFMHNAWRDPGLPFVAGTPGRPALRRATCTTKRGARKARRACAKQRAACARLKARGKRGPKACGRPAVAATPGGTPSERVLFATEENIVSDCEASGRFVAYDLQGTFDGEGFKDTATTKHRMAALDTWTPEGAEGSNGCASAHYFASRGDGLFANAFYEQGVRFLDLSDPKDIRQVGWWRPADTNAFAPYWHDGLVYVADFTRGVDVLRFKGSTASRTVRAPLRATRSRALRFSGDVFGGLCPLPGIDA